MSNKVCLGSVVKLPKEMALKWLRFALKRFNLETVICGYEV